MDYHYSPSPLRRSISGPYKKYRQPSPWKEIAFILVVSIAFFTALYFLPEILGGN